MDIDKIQIRSQFIELNLGIALVVCIRKSGIIQWNSEKQLLFRAPLYYQKALALTVFWFLATNKAEPQGSQGKQTRGTWDVCHSITEVCSSNKRQTIYIGSVEVVTDPFSLEGVLYIKLTSHVSISVFPRMIFV